jgi:TolA-binding protein
MHVVGIDHYTIKKGENEMFSSKIHSVQILIVAACLVLAPCAFAASEAYNKGFEDGKAFGMRTGKSKGEKAGYKKGFDEGRKKGLADAESGTVLPAPEASPQPAAEIPEPEVPADIPVPEPPVDEAPAEEPVSEETPAPAEEGTESGAELTEKALSLYPDLLPQAPSLEGVSDEVTTDPSVTTLAGEAAAGKALIGDAELEYSTEYSKGFAIGYLEGYKNAYGPAEDEGYDKGYPEGYKKGQDEYKQLHYNANGEVLTAEQQYKIGRKFLMNEKYEDAIVRFDLVADSGYDNEWMDDALYWKAWACYNTGQFQRGIKAVSQMLEVVSDSSLLDDALYCKGMCYEYLETGGFLGMGKKKHYVEAAECFYTLIARYPDSQIIAEAYFRLGFNYERLRDKKAAIEAYTVVVEKYPNSSVAFKAQRRLADLK